MLSNTCKYAIRAVIYIAHNAKNKEERIGIKKISTELSIPTPFLGKILQTLVKHKVLVSTKGPNGGFGIERDPFDITMYEIVDVIDGEDLFNNCLLGVNHCAQNEDKHCPVHDKFKDIRINLKDIFKTTNIGQIVNEVKSGKEFIEL